MKVKSTGLGKTTLTAEFTKLAPNGDPNGMILAIESKAPVHWHITVTMGGDDLRQVIGMALKPSVLLTLLSMLVKGNKVQ
ncbi:MAG: hypothetical protein M1343_13190 [Chloroflexi bacterium]|nr:hypothetical protein [Chloroflexota bacterium]MDA8188078.1 hypothetical protein [Dehalococcoidales bacterium]